MKLRSVLLVTSLVLSGTSVVTLHGYDFTASGAQLGAATTQISSAFDTALAHQGGAEAVSRRNADFDAAVDAGVPLADAGLSDAEAADLWRQGSNVVIPCSTASRGAAEINSLLAQAGDGEASLLPCGGYNPRLARAAVADPATASIAESTISH